METDCSTEIIQRKAGWISLLKSAWYCMPPVGDLEEKRLMSLWSVGQQPSVSACMDKSWLWSPEEWNKPARNYLADKDGSKGKAGSTDVNLQYLYESFFALLGERLEDVCVSGLSSLPNTSARDTSMTTGQINMRVGGDKLCPRGFIWKILDIATFAVDNHTTH